MLPSTCTASRGSQSLTMLTAVSMGSGGATQHSVGVLQAVNPAQKTNSNKSLFTTVLLLMIIPWLIYCNDTV